MTGRAGGGKRATNGRPAAAPVPAFSVRPAAPIIMSVAQVPNPPPAMLWAQFQPKNQVEQNAFWAGVIFGMILWGLIPLVVGLIFTAKLRSNPRAQGRAVAVLITAIAGSLLSAATAFAVGCLGGLPMALVFTIIILVVAMTAPDRRRYNDDDDYDRRRRRRRLRYDELDDLEDEDDRPRRRRRDFDDY